MAADATGTWQVYTRIPIHWKGEDVPAGAIVTVTLPDDREEAEYWSKFGAWGTRAGGPGADAKPSPPGGEDGGENGGDKVMSTGQASHVVGRRRAAR